MFHNLTERLSSTLQNVIGKSKITESNIRQTLKEVRNTLLEADVALSIVKDLTNKVHKRAVGLEVKRSLNPGQVFIKIVQDELTMIMGEENDHLNLNCQPPAIILVAGLQGAGKTTTVAKLAFWLKENNKKSVLITSTDIYRPAAIKQLEILAQENDLHFFPSSTNSKPANIVKDAVKAAKLKQHDVLIIDTAGRLHIDDKMMDEIKEIHKISQPIETLFVIDAMIGQDAVNTAKAFHEALDLTGIILTKADGDTRGGAALSARYITGKPIKFVGVSEKIDGLEVFHPKRIASRILGMGDMLTLIEKAEKKFDKEKSDKFIKKIQKGKAFDLNDLKEQLMQLKQLGGLSGFMDKIPSFGKFKQNLQHGLDNKALGKIEAIINSMTPKERCYPDIISSSRKKRIANGSGTQPQDVNRLLKQHKQMGSMMKKMKGNKMSHMMRSLKGQLPF